MRTFAEILGEKMNIEGFFCVREKFLGKFYLSEKDLEKLGKIQFKRKLG